MLIFKMLSSVELDDEARSVTNEVSNIRPDRRLPPEACAMQPVCTKLVPHQQLGIGGLAPKRAHARSKLWCDPPLGLFFNFRHHTSTRSRCRSPSLTLPPQAGEGIGCAMLIE